VDYHRKWTDLYRLMSITISHRFIMIQGTCIMKEVMRKLLQRW
jgi:hypothetical protein